MAYTSEIEKLERRFAENPSGRNFAPLADAYRKAGELDRAIELCKGGLERHPDYVSAHIVYGRCLMDMKNDAEAEQVFQKILSLDPENIIALKVLADIADRNGRYEDTVQWLSRLLAADPMNGDASEALARAKGKAALAAKVTEPIVPPAAVEETVAGLVPPPAEPPAPATEPEPAVRESGLIDIDVALAQAPTTAITKPDFVIERAAIQEAPPALEAAPPSQDIEVFDGTVDFNAVANEAAKAEGIELQEDIHLKADAAPIEGLARTQYEGSGMFKLEASEEQAPPPPAPELEEAPPSVDLPLIMPEDLEAPVARKTSLPKPPPPAPEPVRVSAPPAAVALSDDDGAADTTALSQAEPVVTETMAELYLKQGHQEDALRVYEALLTQRPGDARLQAKVDELSGRAAPVASVPVVGAAPAAAAAPARRQLARAASGQSAPEFLRRVLRGEAVAGAPAPPVAAAQGSALESAFASVSAEAAPEVEPAEPPGAPTQPADDNISLDAVFGDQVGRASGAELPSAPAPAAGPGGGTGGFSFDDFFGAQPSAGGQTSPAQQKPPSSGRTTRQPADDEDLDQFQSWLKGLKS